MFADLETHVAWLRRFALRQALAVLPLGRANEVVIRVDTGLMAGTSTRVRGETLRVGGAPDCQIQLVDEGVGDHHASIRLYSSIFGMLVDVTAHEPIQLGRESLAAGTSSGLARLPVAISVGGVAFNIRSLPTTGVMRHVGRDGLVVASLSLVAVASLFLFVTQLVRTSQIGAVEAAMLATPAPLTPQRADGQVLAQARLADLGLAADVSLSVGEGGSLLVSGAVPAARWGDWQRFRTWYDQETGLPTLVSQVTKAPKLVELRVIEAVQLHAPATVFFTTGEPARVGDVLEEGWTLTGIDAEGLTLERANESTRILF